jgi:MoaA/NifB/PqqE/SkfB family radical SAM enzyme
MTLRQAAVALLGVERAHELLSAPPRLLRSALGRLGKARTPPLPRLVNWDLTYACPLRCEHCYSESGRRPKLQLGRDKLFAIADVLCALRPIPEVVFSGGEPLLVKDLSSLASHMQRRGARLALYTSGYGLDEAMALTLAQHVERIAVSIDGDDATVHDRIRGRAGSFDTAVRAIGIFDGVAARVGKPFRLGIECSVVRSNLHHLEGLVSDIATRFPRVSFVNFGAAIPTGLASEEAYARRELLDERELVELAARQPRLAALARRDVVVRVYDNAGFLMQSRQISAGRANDDLAKIEADGRLRAMDIYEGTVGSVLEEPFSVLWARACARHREGFVRMQLDSVRSMIDWAAATRAIDRH